MAKSSSDIPADSRDRIQQSCQSFTQPTHVSTDLPRPEALGDRTVFSAAREIRFLSAGRAAIGSHRRRANGDLPASASRMGM